MAYIESQYPYVHHEVRLEPILFFWKLPLLNEETLRGE